jgi:hypothetical protein
MPESSTELIARRLAQYPKEAFAFFSDGFAAASTLSKETLNLVLNSVIEDIKRGTRNVDGAALKPLTNLSERESNQLASVFSLVIGLLSESEATPEDFVSAAKGKLFHSEHETTALAVAVSICASRSAIGSAIERAQLAGSVLPSLDIFDIAVDMRLRVVDGELKTAVPVAVLRLNSDAGDDFWLQLTKGDVEDIIRKLSKSLEDMKFAETLTLRKS